MKRFMLAVMSTLLSPLMSIGQTSTSPVVPSTPAVMHYYVSQIPIGLEAYAQTPFKPYVVIWVIGGDSSIDGFAATITYTNEQSETKTETSAALRGQQSTGFVFWTGKASGIRVSVRPFRITSDTAIQSASN